MPSEKGFSGLSKIPRLRVLHYPGIYRDLGRAALSGRLIEEPEIAQFEERLARYVGVRHVIAVSSARLEARRENIRFWRRCWVGAISCDPRERP